MFVNNVGSLQITAHGYVCANNPGLISRVHKTDTPLLSTPGGTLAKTDTPLLCTPGDVECGTLAPWR